MYYLVRIINGNITYLQVPHHPSSILKNFPLSCCNESLLYSNYIDITERLVTSFGTLKSKKFIPLFNIDDKDIIEGNKFILTWSLTNDLSTDKNTNTGRYDFIVKEYLNLCTCSYYSNDGYGDILTNNLDENPYIWFLKKNNNTDLFTKYYLVKYSNESDLNYLRCDQLNDTYINQLIEKKDDRIIEISHI